MHKILDSAAHFLLLNPPYLSQVMVRPFVYAGWRLFLELDRWAFLRSERFGEAELRQLQCERLKHILNFARKHTAYWSNRIPDSIDLDPFKTLKSLPILTREVLKNSDPSLFVGAKTAGWRKEKIATSGTTTTPLEFYADKLSFLRMEAEVQEILGFKESDALARVNLKFPPFRPLGRHLTISFFDEPRSYQRIVSHLKEFRPTHIFGPTSSVLTMAHILDSHHVRYPFKSATVVSEHLLEKDKVFIEQTLGCAVFSLYASREAAGPIAYECGERNGMHVNTASFYVELLDEDGREVQEGEEGNVVVTMFENKTTMFIRYKLGDRASYTTMPCPCGRTTPRIFLLGRDMHFVTLKNGNTAPLLSVVGLVRDFIPLVRQYQFIQNQAGRVTARIVTSYPVSDETKQNFFNEAQKRFGGQLSIELEAGNFIEGKNILFINNLGG